MNKYKTTIDKYEMKPNYLYNIFKAFICGGFICLIGQILIEIYLNFGFSKNDSSSLMSVTLIFISSLLTGIGIYDKFGQYAKAGSFIPITGFANSMTSSALEYKSDGIILGVASNLFKLAGSVITFAVVSAYISSIIRYLISLL